MKHLDNQNLLTELKSMVAQERALIKKVIEYLEEVEVRRLYLSEGFSSMFAFCTDFLGYTNQEAHTRIQAMRLSRSVPEVKEHIQSGELSLTVAAKIQSHVQRENRIQKENQKPVLSALDKKELIEAVKGESVRNSEAILLGIFPHHEEAKPEKIKASPSTVRLEVNLPKEVFETLQKLKNIRSNLSYEELIGELALLGVKKWDLSKGAKTLEKAKTKIEAPSKRSDAHVLVTKQGRHIPSPLRRPIPAPLRRHIPAPLRRRVWQRDQGQCQFKNHRTGHMCASKFNLEVDHIRPFALSGEHSEENLRLLCASHNAYRARKTFGNWQGS